MLLKNECFLYMLTCIFIDVVFCMKVAFYHRQNMVFVLELAYITDHNDL